MSGGPWNKGLRILAGVQKRELCLFQDLFKFGLVVDSLEWQGDYSIAGHPVRKALSRSLLLGLGVLLLEGDGATPPIRRSSPDVG